MATRKEPKQTRSKRTVEFILRGAHQAILTSERVSTSSIARISGVGIGSVYQYFKNKEQVFYSLYRYLNKETYALVSDLGGDGYRDPYDKVDDAIEALVPQFLSYQRHMRVFMKMVTKLNAFALITGSRRRTARAVAKQLVEDFPVSGERAELLSVILTNAFVGCIHNYLLEEEKSLSEEELTRGLKLMCKGTIARFVEAEANAKLKPVPEAPPA